MKDETKSAAQAVGPYRPNLCFYHANAKGTGSALKMNLHPAHDSADGCIMLTVANQMTVGDRTGPNPTYARFDWENAVCVKLDFNDLTQMLQVFRGECESVCDGKGLYHTSPRGTTSIRLSHFVDPSSSYMLDICRRRGEVRDETRVRFNFSSAEALGVSEAIAGAMHLVCFGIPMPVSRDASAHREAARRQRDASEA